MNELKAIGLCLQEATVRMEQIIFLPGMLGMDGDDTSDALVSFLAEEEEDTIVECFPGMPAALFDDGRDDFTEAFSQWACGANLHGFLIQFATPVKTPIGKGVYNFSWGHYRTKWIYDESIKRAADRAVEWADQCRAKEEKVKK